MSTVYANLKPKSKEPRWHQLLMRIQGSYFPSPYRQAEKDNQFENTVRLAIRSLDRMKHQRDKCYLGKPEQLDFEQCRTEATLPEQMAEDIETVIRQLVDFFNGMVNWNHPFAMANVMPPPTIPSIIANTLAAVFNPDISSDDFCWNVAATEIEAVAIMAQLIGYDQRQAGGIFTFGGTGSSLYATKLALTKCLGLNSRYEGIRTDAQVLISQAGHYCQENCADWIGLGMKNIREIEVDKNNRMSVAHMKEVMQACHAEGKPIAMVVCTLGTTDAFAIDPIYEIKQAIDEFATQYHQTRPMLYADAVIGWPWTAFRDYDFSQNPLQFSEEAARVLKECYEQIQYIHLADAVGCDFHKTGWSPYNCSLFMVKNRQDFELLQHDFQGGSYLYNLDEYHPGTFTLETTRAGAYSLAGWANLKLFGREGLRVMLGHLVEVQINLRRRLHKQSTTVCVNPNNHGAVTLFRVYPRGVNAEQQYQRELTNPAYREQLQEHNKLQKAIATEMRKMLRENGENAPAISLTETYRSPEYAPGDKSCRITALKAYPMSPYSDEKAMETLMLYVLKARDNLLGKPKKKDEKRKAVSIKHQNDKIKASQKMKS